MRARSRWPAAKPAAFLVSFLCGISYEAFLKFRVGRRCIFGSGSLCIHCLALDRDYFGVTVRNGRYKSDSLAVTIYLSIGIESGSFVSYFMWRISGDGVVSFRKDGDMHRIFFFFFEISINGGDTFSKWNLISLLWLMNLKQCYFLNQEKKLFIIFFSELIPT